MLEPGDLIEFQRVGYQHWGIYVGKGYVVHFTFPVCGTAESRIQVSHIPAFPKVQKERLRNVARVSSYAVNNQLDKKHPPLPLSHVVKRAEHLVGKNIDYNLVMSNCEHFATLIRYGIAESQQVSLVNIHYMSLNNFHISDRRVIFPTHKKEKTHLTEPFPH
uniref:LRAT domain-containing protein n=1 Tax=Gopherus agassizii TaxID=38772 RepID=A0A452I853_9SAUR